LISPLFRDVIFDLLSLPLPLTVVCTLLGLLVGSFLNVVIHRLPKMLEREWQTQCAELRGENPGVGESYNLVLPPSTCPTCGHHVRAWENIPVLSYMLLGGKCSNCGAGISWRYPLVEAMTGFLSAFAAWHFGFGLSLAAALILIWSLIALAFIDFDTQLLPDNITQPLIWIGLLLNVWGTFTPLHAAVIGAIAGYLCLWSVYWLFKLATGKEGMGYGDFKLLAALAAWMGWQLIPLIVLLSAVVGAVVGILLIVLAKRGRHIPIPFGPYLAAAGVVALFWGHDLVDIYLRLLA
jgi:leader peptidase (prepilin peptidase) / N-methyltransferase